MADESVAAEATEGGKSKKKLIIFIALGVIIVAILSAAAVYFLLGSGSDEPDAVAEPVRKEAIYSKVRTLEGKPSFVATLKSADGKRHYLRAFVEAKSRDQDVVDALTLHMPLVVSRLNQLFSMQSFDDLQTIQAKQKLRQDATQLVQDFLQEKMGKPGIEKILFTDFVMQ
ncbi:flagellar basal body-associated FliL family protein [Neptunomonas antarctica]|uniref:Flagellar protein FliL n=1 Tax=Neptunomonas antarctica TaxID=619304 RepID=A0A1N7JCD0_9GAMM|nr:flagellar basal body-associated FliL family protein [Neptunomonas antarctica]SIS46970.1 flagellar FliL protein [Neptunomonas antarctica]